MGQLENPRTADDWQREEMSRCIAAARDLFAKHINQRASVGSLSDLEIGWVVAAVIFESASTRARQATTEGISYGYSLHVVADREPQPWDYGAVETILPTLAETNKLDWTKPLGEWPKDQIVLLAWRCFQLVGNALVARDEGSLDVVQRLTRSETERRLSADRGGPLMDREELSGEVPF